MSISHLCDKRRATATPTHCDNRYNRIVEEKAAAYGGRPAQSQDGPPLHTRFRKWQSGNPGGRTQKKVPALLADALNEQVFVTIDGERRKITKREAVVHQRVNKSATADLRDAVRHDQGRRAKGQRQLAGPRTSPARYGGEGGGATFVDGIRQQILAEMAAESIEAAGAEKT
jgi:hypothetical protein